MILKFKIEFIFIKNDLINKNKRKYIYIYIENNLYFEIVRNLK